MASHKLISVFFVSILAVNLQATRLQNWLDEHSEPAANAGHNSQNGLSSSADRRNTRSSSTASSLSSSHQNTNQNAINNNDRNSDCLQTQQTFVARHIGEASLTINTKIHDPDMGICYHGKSDSSRLSCCTQTMERHYTLAAETDFYETIQSTSSYLHDLLTHNAAHYQELFLSLLQGAHNKTERLFSEVYHLPLIDRWGPTESLFLDLQAFMRKHDVSIHKSIETFFDELFPLVFHNNVNDPRTSELDNDYRECLMEIRKDVYPAPFGGIPGKLAHQLAHSFKSARAFLDGLELGVKVLDSTSRVPLTTECKEALTRLEFCGHCDGHTGVYPCRGFCYNVMRGCLAHVTDINVHWNEFIDALESLTLHMRQGYDIEMVLHSFHTKISEAIMHAMETGVKFSHKVKDRCGPPKNTPSLPESSQNLPMNTPPSRATLNSAMLPAPMEMNARLVTKIEMFMRNVLAAKGFFSHLPDTMCTDSRFSSGVESPCWNGETVGPYNKSIMMRDMSAQIQNPEVTVQDKAPSQITEISDDLQTMKKTLSSKISLQEKMQGDSPQAGLPLGDDPNVYYGQNAGHRTWESSGDWAAGYKHEYYPGGYYPMDDEDWYGSGYGGGSGSGYGDRYDVRTSSRKPGAGYQPDTPEFTFDGDTHKTVAPPYQPQKPEDNYDPSGAASAIKSLSVSVITGVVLLIFCIV